MKKYRENKILNYEKHHSETLRSCLIIIDYQIKIMETYLHLPILNNKVRDQFDLPKCNLIQREVSLCFFLCERVILKW